MDPAYVIGGELIATGSNAGWGSGEWIVIEADESDRSLLKFTPGDRGADERRARPPRDLRPRSRPRGGHSGVPARSGAAVVWDRPGAARAGAAAGVVAYDATGAELGRRRLAVQWRGQTVELTRSRASQRGQRRRGTDRVRARRGRPAADAVAAIAVVRRRPPADGAARGDRGRRRRLRRLRAPSDRGRGRDRRRTDARAAPAGRRLPAASVLAHARARARVRSGAGRRRHRRACSTSTRLASARRTSRESSGLLIAEAAADAGAGTARRVAAGVRRRATVTRGDLRGG